MRLRKRDASLDMSFGHGAADYWSDVPEAPAQFVAERLSLYTGEWFLDRAEGTPWRTQVLGKFTEGSRDRAIRARILATQGVAGIDGYAAQQNRDTRKMAAQVTLRTAFGVAPVSIGSITADIRTAR